MDLWSHVSTSPLVVLQFVDIFVSWEAKVKDFDVHILVDKNILGFQISVNNVLVMHVFNCVNNLLEEKARIILNHAISVVHHLLEVE